MSWKNCHWFEAMKFLTKKSPSGEVVHVFIISCDYSEEVIRFWHENSTGAACIHGFKWKAGCIEVFNPLELEYGARKLCTPSESGCAPDRSLYYFTFRGRNVGRGSNAASEVWDALLGIAHYLGRHPVLTWPSTRLSRGDPFLSIEWTCTQSTERNRRWGSGELVEGPDGDQARIRVESECPVVLEGASRLKTDKLRQLHTKKGGIPGVSYLFGSQGWRKREIGRPRVGDCIYAARHDRWWEWALMMKERFSTRPP